MSDLAHLDPRVYRYVDGDVEDRVAYVVAEKYIPYAASEYIINEITQVARQYKSDRYKCVLIYADPGDGKTMILRECLRLLQAVESREISPTSVRHFPVVFISLTEDADRRQMYSRILKFLRIPHSLSDRPSYLYEQACDGMRSCATRILIIDELHNLLRAPSLLESSMRVLRDFANLPLALMCAGTLPARNCLLADEQMAVRFRCHRLDRWTISSSTRDFLATLESRIPLARPSNLSGPELLPLIVKLSSGHLGTFVTAIREAARDAIYSGDEMIGAKGLKLAVERILSQRLSGAPR